MNRFRPRKKEILERDDLKAFAKRRFKQLLSESNLSVDRVLILLKEDILDEAYRLEEIDRWMASENRQKRLKKLD